MKNTTNNTKNIDSLIELDQDRTEARSIAWLFLVALTAVIAAVAIGAVLLRGGGKPQAEPALLSMGAVISPDRFEQEGTITLEIEPANVGKNQFSLVVEPQAGSRLGELRQLAVSFTPLAPGATPVLVDVLLAGEQLSGKADVTFDANTLWQATVFDPDARRDAPLASFVFLVPDPNLHGADAVGPWRTQPEAQDLFDRAMDRLTSLHRVTYVQDLTDGKGLGIRSYHAVNDGSDGSEAAFIYENPGGFEAIVIGTTAWSRDNGGEWEVRQTNPPIPPAEWGEEYAGATGFQLGPELSTSSGDCRAVTFVTPETANRSIAWYLWCVDEKSGDLLRDAMISRDHYMITDFSGFDAPLSIEPPNMTGSASLEVERTEA